MKYFSSVNDLKTEDDRIDFLFTFAYFYAEEHQEMYQDLIKDVCILYNIDFDERFEKIKKNVITKKYINEELFDIFGSIYKLKKFIDTGFRKS